MNRGPGPLQPGERVHLLKNKRKYIFPENRISVFQGDEVDESEISYVGAAGFRVRGEPATYWWYDRGETWSSLKLDRMDAARDRFNERTKG